VISDIGGVQNTANDLIVHGKSNEEHDRNLHTLMQRLEENHTLNSEKCQFQMDKVFFMGLLILKYGIGPTEEPVGWLQRTFYPQLCNHHRTCTINLQAGSTLCMGQRAGKVVSVTETAVREEVQSDGKGGAATCGGVQTVQPISVWAAYSTLFL